MAGRILLINPISHNKKRKGVSRGTSRRKLNPRKKGAATMAAKRKHRTAAQKAATRRMIAANRARKSNPVRHKRRRRNPLRAVAHTAVRRRRRNPIARVHHRRRRRNPIGGMSIVNRMLMPAVTAAGGALALDVLWGYLPIPANLKTGSLQYVAKGAGAVAIGILGAKVMKKQTAEAMAVGALTVVIHGAAKDLIAKMLPSVHLGFLNPGFPAGYYDQAQVAGLGEYVSGMGEYVSGGMGEYVSGFDSENAYANYY